MKKLDKLTIDNISNKIKKLNYECRYIRKQIKIRNDIILNSKVKYNDQYIRDYIEISDKLLDDLIEKESQRTFYVNYFLEYVHSTFKNIEIMDNKKN